MAEEELFSEVFVNDVFVGGSAIADSDGGDTSFNDAFVGDLATGGISLSDPSTGDPFVDVTMSDTVSGDGF